MSERGFEYWKIVSIISAIFASVSMWIMIYVGTEHIGYTAMEMASLFSSFFIGSTFTSLGVLKWGGKVRQG